MKVWITKYALTQGIKIAVGERCDSFGCRFREHLKGTHGNTKTYDPCDWHSTYESALVRAKDMKAMKLKSIARQTEVLIYMDFENPEPKQIAKG